MTDYLPILTERGRSWARFLALLALLALLAWVAVILRGVLTPVVAALALAYILNPLITLLERRFNVRRAVSVGCGLVLLVIVGAILLLAATIQIVQLAGNLPYYTGQTLDWIDRTIPGLMSNAGPEILGDLEQPNGEPAKSPDSAALSGPHDATTSQPTANQSQGAILLELASRHGFTAGRAVLGYITGLVSDLFYWLSLVVLLPLYTFFFLLNFNEIVRRIHELLPGAYRATIVRVVTTVDAAISSFFRGRLLICLAVGLLTGLGWLALGLFGVRVPYNLALGGLVGLLNLVPFMSVLGLPPALILTYLEADAAGENWVSAIAFVLGVYMAVQAVESFVLTPTIGAKAAGLHPVTTVIVLLIGGQLIGFLGLLLAIPIAGTLKSLFAEYLLPEIRRLAALAPEPAAERGTVAEAEPDRQRKE